MAKFQIANSPAKEDFKEISVPDTMRTLYTHRKAIIAVFGIMLAAGIFLSFLPRHFEAQGDIWVEPGESSSMSISSLSSMLNGQANDIVSSEVLALQSRTLLLRVAKELDLANNRQFWGAFAWISQPDPADRTMENALTRDELFKKMSSTVDVENDGKDEIITVTAKTISPELSAKIVNTLINDYLAYLFEMRYGATNRASGWLIQQLGDLKKKVDSDQVELTKLQEQLGIVGFNPTTSTYIYGESLGELMKASDEAKVERIVAEAKDRYLQDADPNLIEGEISLLPQPQETSGAGMQSLLQTLRVSLAQSKATYARLMTQFGSNYPEVQQAKAQMDALQTEVSTEEKRILNQAQLSYTAASANERMASGAVQSEKAKVFGAHDDMVRFVLLAQDYASARSLYEGLITHLQEASITAGLEAGDIDIVDLADVPGKPTIVGPILFIPGGILLGLILGSFLALWLGTLDRRITGSDQVEKITGLPLLAYVPHVKFNKSEVGDPELPQLIVSARRSHYAEAIQSLRASLLLTKPGSAPKAILVTSATPNEGKSTTVVNLAVTFARHGARVLVADCDLRRGTIAKRLRLSSAKGLSSVITRQFPLEAVIQEVQGVPGLFVLGDGPRPPDPAVLIGSDEMRRLMDHCKEQFDFVILDSPPILGIADGLHLGQLVDSVILVVRENVSNRKAVLETATMMAASHLPVSGFVFNDMDPRASSYSYGYTYRDYYRGYYTDAVDSTRAEVSK